MAIKPKKTSSAKTSSKKSKKINKKTNIPFKKNMFIVVSVFLVIALVVFGYFLGNKSENKFTKKDNVLEELSQLETKKPENIDKRVIVKSLDAKDIKKTVSPKPKATKKEEKKKAKVDSKKSVKVENILLAYRGKKPRLVIVIDDVHSKKQLEMIQRLKMKITPSIFPPYSLAKESHLLAKDLKHYMIHLPMESGNKKFNTQTKTLMTTFSDEKIVDRVMELRQLFPKARYVNNHTGSVFTSNYDAMKKLYVALKLEGFVFVDSFTQATSKVEQIAHEHGDAYVRRDSFIDNVQSIKAIQKQLKLAVKKAKKNGYAVAIGHPHKVTMRAIRQATSILKEVELVYIDEIYRRK